MDPQVSGESPPTSTTNSSPSSPTNTSWTSGLTADEQAALGPTIDAYHRYAVGPNQCSSLLSQRVRAPSAAVWSIVRRFDRPQIYKHFIRSCSVISNNDNNLAVGCLRELSVISGLPATTSTERLDVLDDERMVTGFTIVGGEHRLRNYRSVTTVTEFEGEDGEAWSVVVESYVVDVPEGNSEDDTRLFADTVVRLNLQKLASVAESMAVEKMEKKMKMKK